MTADHADALRPYDEGRLLPYETVMRSRPPTVVDPQTLRPTQPFAVIARLVALHHGGPAEGPDPYPHVVDHDGGLYVHNGHHRWLCDLLGGDMTTVRIQASDG